MSNTSPQRKPKPAAHHKGEGGKTNYSEMKTSEIRDLIDFIAQSGLNEVDIETKELKLHVKREPDQKVMKSAPVMAAPVAVAAPAVAAPVAVAPVAQKTEKAAAGKNTVDIKSP